ncbi:MAG: mechanosensitive ion channel family protein [Pseudomonadota bacterium]
MSKILELQYFGNTLRSWLLAVAVVLSVMIVFPAVRAWLVRNRPIFLAKGHPLTELISVLIDKTRPTVRLIVALYLGLKILNVPAKVAAVADFIIIVGAWVQVAIWAGVTLKFMLERKQPEDLDGDGDLDPSPAINVVLFIGQVVIWAIVVLVALANLGVNITGLVAGLGIGGIAVALAVQTILKDLFSSLSIAFDKPFMVDDLLRIDNIEGTVEHVGVRSTRLRSTSGEQIVISNGDLLNSRIHNMGHMPQRRVVMRIHIQYEATPAQVEQVSKIVEQAVTAQQGARFVSCLLAQLGTYALEFDVIYFANPGVAPHLLRTSDAVNRAIFRQLSEAGIHLAYPVARQINV